jgi:hypothetical protein
MPFAAIHGTMGNYLFGLEPSLFQFFANTITTRVSLYHPSTRTVPALQQPRSRPFAGYGRQQRRAFTQPAGARNSGALGVSVRLSRAARVGGCAPPPPPPRGPPDGGGG